MTDLAEHYVYPRHGVVRTRGTADGRVTFEADGGLKLSAPVGNFEQIGIRPVTSARNAKKMLTRLAMPAVIEPEAWARRFKRLSAMLSEGSLDGICDAVRTLAARDQISAGEKRMLATARNLLSGELAIALGIERTASDARIGAALARARVKAQESEAEA